MYKRQAAAIGVPKRAENAALMPHMIMTCLSLSSKRKNFPIAFPILPPICRAAPVSYTHLDVYKRQGYNTLYGKVAGLGTQNGQTRGSSFREHIDGTEKKAPYQHLAQNGTITYKGVTFVCDTDRNRITLGDVTDRSKCLNISLKGGGCLMVNRDNLSDLSQAITMFCPEDINLSLIHIFGWVCWIFNQ